MENTDLTIRILNIEKLKTFDNFPFSLDIQDNILNLSLSIKQNGLIEPIIVRPIDNEKYTHEIVSGHRRVIASKLIGQPEIKCDIRELDDNEATILMVDSTLTNRQNIKPSEKAKAYKMRLDAIKSQGKRNDLTSAQLVHKFESSTSRDKLGVENSVSGETIRRYIRLNYLIPPLLEKLDERKIAFTSSVELSYLHDDEQQKVLEVLESEEKYGMTLGVASKLKNISQYGKLSKDKISKIITDNFNKSPKSYKLPYSSVNKYFDKNATPKEISNTIDKALAEWRIRHPLRSSKPKNLER